MSSNADVGNCFRTPLDECPAEVRSEWAQLAGSARFNPTLGPAWLAVIAAALAPAGVPLTVLACRDAMGRLSALLPYFLTRRRMMGLRLRVLQPASNLMSYHAQVMTNAEVAPVLEELLSHCGRWDIFHFANVPLESATADAIRSLAPRMGSLLQVMAGDESPYLKIRDSWTSYVASRNKKFRYKQRQRRDAILSDPGFDIRWYVAPADANPLLSDMLKIEENSWKEGAGRNISARAAELDYHRRLVAFLASEGFLLANVLYHRSRPIAYSLCCHIDGWVGHLKTSFDREFASLSPGAFVIDISVERAFDLRAREFDFLGAADPHKLAWTSATRKHADFFLFGTTLKSRIVAGIKRLRMRGTAVART